MPLLSFILGKSIYKFTNLEKKDWEGKKAEQGTLCVAEEEVPYMTKAEILANFDQACKELKLNLEGKLEFKTLEEALDEL